VSLECLLQPRPPVSCREVCSWAHIESHHCASCTVISGCVLCGHRAQLQRELVLGRVSGDGDAALEGWAVVSVSIRTYLSHPLQTFPWGLADPAPAVTTGNGVTRDCTGEGQGL
jgi:hypothetical protein